MLFLIVRDGAGGPTDPWWYSVGSAEWLTDKYAATRYASRQQADWVIEARGLAGARAVEAEHEDGI